MIIFIYHTNSFLMQYKLIIAIYTYDFYCVTINLQNCNFNETRRIEKVSRYSLKGLKLFLSYTLGSFCSLR